MFSGFGSYSAFGGGEFSIYRRDRPQEKQAEPETRKQRAPEPDLRKQRVPEPETRKQRAPEPPRQRPEPTEVPMATEAAPKAVERKAPEHKAPEPKAPKTPRLKVIADALNPPQETKSRKSTVMSVLWKQAKDKGVTGYNRMTRAQLEAAIAV